MPSVLSAVKMPSLLTLLEITKRIIILSMDSFIFHSRLYHSAYYSTYEEPASHGCIYYLKIYLLPPIY